MADQAFQGFGFVMQTLEPQDLRCNYVKFIYSVEYCSFTDESTIVYTS